MKDCCLRPFRQQQRRRVNMRAAQAFSLLRPRGGSRRLLLSNELGPCARVIYVQLRSPPGPRLHQLHIFLLSPVKGNIFKIKEQKSEMITSYRFSSVEDSGSTRME